MRKRRRRKRLDLGCCAAGNIVYMYKQETIPGGKEILLRCLRVPRDILGFKRKEYDVEWKKNV
jgi:hypothetical protein